MDTAEILLGTIEYAIDKKISNAEIDKTIICTVTEINGNIVKLSHGGSVYTVALKNNGSIKVFDKVHLKFPSGQFVDRYLEEDIASSGNGSGGGTGAVNSVNGKVGNVIIGIDDISGLRAELSNSGGARNQIELSRSDPNRNFVGAIWYEIIQ